MACSASDGSTLIRGPAARHPSDCGASSDYPIVTFWRVKKRSLHPHLSSIRIGCSRHNASHDHHHPRCDLLTPSSCRVSPSIPHSTRLHPHSPPSTHTKAKPSTLFRHPRKTRTLLDMAGMCRCRAAEGWSGTAARHIPMPKPVHLAVAIPFSRSVNLEMVHRHLNSPVGADQVPDGPLSIPAPARCLHRPGPTCQLMRYPASSKI